MALVLPCTFCTSLKRQYFPINRRLLRISVEELRRYPPTIQYRMQSLFGSVFWLWHGCCTSCAIRVKSGELRKPQALGISAELKDQVYWLQFGRYFARGPVERDDYALELAMGDE